MLSEHYSDDWITIRLSLYFTLYEKQGTLKFLGITRQSHPVVNHELIQQVVIGYLRNF